MPLIARVLLLLFHVIYRISCIILALSRSLRSRASQSPVLVAPRSKTPQHVAIVLVDYDQPVRDALLVKDVMIECARRAVGWCRVLKIPRLSVYDKAGVLRASIPDILAALDERVDNFASGYPRHHVPSVHEDRMAFPITPPPSDRSGENSRCWTPEPFEDYEPVVGTFNAESRSNPVFTVQLHGHPEHSCRRARRREYTHHSPPTSQLLTLQVVSRDAGKPAIASIARELSAANPSGDVQIDEQDVTALVEGATGLPEVDLLIVHPLGAPAQSRHTLPLELHGFPPVQIRLAEIYHNSPAPFSLSEWWRAACGRRAAPLSEVAFRRALDHYDHAEMRRGR